jgi:hypothetical protein
LSDLDLRIARAGIVFFVRRLDRRGGREDGSDGGSAELAPRLIVIHCFLHEQLLIHIPGALGNSKIAVFGSMALCFSGMPSFAVPVF